MRLVLLYSFYLRDGEGERKEQLREYELVLYLHVQNGTFFTQGSTGGLLLFCNIINLAVLVIGVHHSRFCRNNRVCLLRTIIAQLVLLFLWPDHVWLLVNLECTYIAGEYCRLKWD